MSNVAENKWLDEANRSLASALITLEEQVWKLKRRAAAYDELLDALEDIRILAYAHIARNEVSQRALRHIEAIQGKAEDALAKAREPEGEA